MNVSRYEPWTVLNQCNVKSNQYFEEGSAYSNASSAATADWIPPADVEEYADRFVLKVDIPGVNANAVEITLEQGILSITGQREKDVSERTCKVCALSVPTDDSIAVSLCLIPLIRPASAPREKTACFRS